MTLVALRPEAEADMRSANHWYEQQQPRLGRAFLEEAKATIQRIQQMPQMYAVVFGGTRRAKLRRFPYLIYYRVLADRIEIIAVLHGSRDPKLWRERVN